MATATAQTRFTFTRTLEKHDKSLTTNFADNSNFQQLHCCCLRQRKHRELLWLNKIMQFTTTTKTNVSLLLSAVSKIG